MIDSSYSANTSFKNIYDSFQHKSAEPLNSYLYSGIYDIYPGDGYVFKLRGSLNYLKSNLSILQQLKWIDRRTKAVFVETTIYNPNLGFFAYITILFEILPSGNILSSLRIDPIKLFDDSIKLSVFLVVYLVLTVLFLLKEALNVYKNRLNYFKSFWNWIELTIISLSISSFALGLKAIYEKNCSLKLIEQTSGYSYLRLQGLAYATQMLIIMLSFCCLFTSIKFIKMFRFNRRILIFSVIFEKSTYELINFGVIFFITYFAFIQMLHLIMIKKISEFKTLLSSMIAGFALLIGYNLKLTSFEITSTDIFLFCSYFTANISFIFFLINILSIAYTRLTENPGEILSYDEINLIEALKKKFQRQERNREFKERGKNVLHEFSKRLNQIVDYCIVVNIFGDFQLYLL